MIGLNIKYIIAGLGITAVMASCAVTKPYSRQPLDMPAQYNTSVALTSDTVQLPWRAFFKDPVLISLIEQALEKNTDINVAIKSMEQLDLARKMAKQALLPTVNATAGANRTWQSSNSLNGSLTEQFAGTKYIDDFSATLAVSWEVDIWQKAKLQREQARAEYLGQKENLVALKTRIIAQVAQAYYNLISLDGQLRIAKENVGLNESTLQMMRLQYNSGQINSLAIEQAEAQKKTAELLIPQALQNIAVQENALRILCGTYPGSIARAAALQEVQPGITFAGGVPAQLLSRRPDLKAAEYAVIAQNAKTGLAKTAMYPTFSLTAQGGLNSFKVNSWFDLPGSITKNLAANIAQPVFQKRALKTAYQTALLEQDKMALQFKQAVLVAVGEVSDALASYQGATERLALVKQKTASLDKATHDATLLYQSGMATYLEVITAQNSKLQNDLEQISIELQQLNSTVDIYRALGGGTEEQ
ncbi:efflux transporter outer membrane subunit [Chitinophaga sp. Cy-1792]|uniref:efflux transporter outer membrane subunit n=1 Tax=Chitinophaga sp. Cy-1792 TaxID=2608339 RepID=UPI0014209B28|nr:efflux transporter outer membrane subunit [Chitinophaga sp. Cy-1792]NIG55075.1 efflux transporter outer membrane subunit [Chitinophaga sp. Cy-1792]